jgi:hypothetical protein
VRPEVLEQSDMRSVADRLSGRIRLERQVEADHGMQASQVNYGNVLDEAPLDSTDLRFG